jgi:hypothetical protein
LLETLEKIIEYGLVDRLKEVKQGHYLSGFEEFSVVSPSADYYNSHLTELKKEFINQAKLQEEYLSDSKNLVFESFEKYTNPCYYLESSSKANNVTATNMVSIVTLLEANDKKYLFTGDAGIETFEEQYLLSNNKLKDLDWLDLPHHGSKNNTSLNMLTHFDPRIVFVSGDAGPNRPHQLITKCLESKRVGMDNVHITNSDKNTWYLKLDKDLNVSRVLKETI